MDRLGGRIAKGRRRTDASLTAERGSADAAFDLTTETAQRALDRLVDGDRVVEDDRLSKLRESLDNTVARARFDSLPTGGSVARERLVVDETRKIERDATDALLGRERHGADAVVETGRSERDAHRARREALRSDTDQELSTERLSGDGTRSELAKTKSELAEAQRIDVAERVRAEIALRESERQLRHAQKMEAVGVLAGGIAHDFNNILSIVLSYGELLLLQMTPDDPMREYVGEIHKAGARAAGLTRQLMMFSHQQVLQPRVIDLNEVLIGADKMLQRLLGADVELISLLARPLGRVRGDVGSIEQVIVNLVINARDAMPTGGTITMETRDVFLDVAYADQHLGVSPGPYVLLVVTDTGSGMGKETLARVFEPFFTTKERGRGTGLGLSTAFGIVQQSGGSIWIDSEVGTGTTLKVYLPRVDEPLDSAQSIEPAVSVGGSETILLVEDDEQVRRVARTVLRTSGYFVLDACNAGEALILSEKHQGFIHLLLTDVVMPHMSGPELAKRLATARPEMSVLCMSGYPDDSTIRDGVLRAQIAYLQKPVTPESLATKVREVLDSTKRPRSAACVPPPPQTS